MSSVQGNPKSLLTARAEVRIVGEDAHWSGHPGLRRPRRLVWTGR